MYYIDEPVRRRRSGHKRMVLLGLLALIVVAVIVILHSLQPDTKISQAPVLTGHVAIKEPETKWVGSPAFRIRVPVDWKQATDADTPGALSWRGGTQADSGRSIAVYVDNADATFPLNRLLNVKADGNKLTLVSDVSDNCINFASKQTTVLKSGTRTGTGVAQATWQGVSFLCDTSDSLREVVGTGSADGMNTVNVTGTSGHLHHYFFVYTDHTALADFDEFGILLRSFEAL